MIKVNATKLRKNLFRYLDRLDQGEIIDIEKNGRKIGRIIPAEPGDWRLKMTQKVTLLHPEEDVFAPMEDVWMDYI